jgi:hypothetical protein
MEILIIATSYYSTAERLVRKGHNVTVIAGNPAGKAPQQGVINGVEV